MAESKSSKKTTTKGKDLPESVKWLLDFANIGSKPGKLCISKTSWKRTPVKRPPSEPADLETLYFDSSSFVEAIIKLDEKQLFEELATRKNIYDLELMRLDFTVFRIINNLALQKIDENPDVLEIMRSSKELAIENFKDDLELMRSTYEVFRAAFISRKEYYLKNSVLYYSDVNGSQWLVTNKGEITYMGSDDDVVPLEEFKNFLSKAGISKVGRNLEYEDVEVIWCHVIYSLLCKENDNTRYYDMFQDTQSFVYEYYKRKQIQLPDISSDGINSLINGLKYSHDNTLIQVTCAYILDFWHNHRELHQHVRQCKCCGKLWIEKTRKKFCCKKCEDRFNQASRQAIRDSLRKQRKKLHKEKKDIAHNEIINWLRNAGGYESKDAEKIYKNEKHNISKNVTSLTNFKRTYGRKSGLI